MIRYKIYQNKQKTGMNAGKWFARSVSDETYDLDRLSAHMSGHNSPYSLGVIRGVLTDMVRCIKELLLDGKSVKIDDLAIFSVGIRSRGTETSEAFSVDKNITGVRLRARATGILSTNNLNLSTQLRQLGAYLKPESGNKAGAGSSQPEVVVAQPGTDPKQPVGDVKPTEPKPTEPKPTGNEQPKGETPDPSSL